MPEPRQHPLDGIADELTDWLHSEASWYVNELIGEYRAPFAAQISESEKLATYRRMFYNQDNEGNIKYDSPNTKGREALYNRVTPDQYVQIAKAVGPKGGIEHMKNLDADIDASEEYRNAEGTDSHPPRY